MTPRNIVFTLLVAALCLTGATAASASPARPQPMTTSTALKARVAAKASLPTCQDEGKCTIVKDENSADPSCTGYASQTTPPPTIRVLVRTGGQTGTYTIQTIPFDTYLDNVLPDEWVGTYDFDALKAGAVAVRSYAWYWVTHYGGYVGSTPSAQSCFDVTDDQLFQVYLPNSASDRTTRALDDTSWVAARVGGQILKASYQRTLTGNTNEACGAGATGTTLSQVGTQNCFDSDTSPTGSTGNKYNVILATYYFPGLQLATRQQQQTPHDFTFEQTSTRATYNAGTWSIDDGYGTTFRYGASTDKPVITDDGDGFAHIGVYRPSDGTWHLAGPTGVTAQTITYGGRSDVPVPAHWNGIAQPSVVAVFRPSDGTWHVRGRASVQYGKSGDVPVPGNWIGDSARATDIAVFRPSTGTWYVRGGTSVQYGQRGDIPVPADYNGDGFTDIAVYRPSTHTFYVRGGTSLHYGVTGDVPVTGDFTGDGRADFAVYRPSTHAWYVKGLTPTTFGSGAPIGAAPYRA